MTLFDNRNPTRATVVIGPTVLFHQEAGTHWAESPECPGWTAAADSKEELDQLIDEARSLKFGPWEVL